MWIKPAQITVTGNLTVSVKRTEEIIYFFHGYDPKGNQFEYTTNDLEATRKAISMFKDMGYKIANDNKYGAPLHKSCVKATNFELADKDDGYGMEMAAREHRNS